MVDHGLARRDGLPVDGFLVVPGVEVSTDEGHMLCVGAVLPEMKGKPALEVADAIRAAGGLAIPAHPYDKFRAGIREPVLERLKNIDAIEVFNAAISFPKYNTFALEYAQRRGLPMIAASDAHHEGSIGTSHMIFEMEELSVASLLKAVARGGKRHEELLGFRDKWRKTLNNWFRLKGKRRYVPQGSM
jgi:predicted metal-dependent phosphoesterase TrpH